MIDQLDQLDQLDPGALTCQECGSRFEHAGRGRKPKRCSDCRRTRSRSTSSESDQAPKRPKGIETLRKNLAQQLTMVGIAVSFFDRFDGEVILSKAEAGADALANLAATNPRIRKALEQSVEVAGWGPVLMWGIQVALPIAAHHGLIPGVQDPAKKTGPVPDGAL